MYLVNPSLFIFGLHWSTTHFESVWNLIKAVEMIYTYIRQIQIEIFLPSVLHA